MKRKDWKTKKLEKHFYGRFKKQSNTIFLRKLFLKKISSLIKKNIKVNFIFYSYILKNFKIRKNSYLKKNYNFWINSFNLMPLFFVNKKINYLELDFKNNLEKNNLDYFFLSSKNLNTYNKNKGVSVNIYYKKIFGLENKYSYNFLINNDFFKNTVLVKNGTICNNTSNNFNNFVPFNINILILLEIYKILNILFIFEFNKK